MLPSVNYDQWSPTCDTLHAHTQVLGKLAVRLAPPEPQLQHAALHLSARGWETRPLPAPDGSGAFVVCLDLRRHEAVIEHSDGRRHGIPLGPDRPVADVTREVLATVESLYPHAAFFAFALPTPKGLETATVEPPAARWETSLGEFVLNWDDVRAASDPHGEALAFGRSAIRHACTACGWDPELAASAQ